MKSDKIFSKIIEDGSVTNSRLSGPPDVSTMFH